MKFRTLKSALYDLDEIEDWVTEHFGPSFAFDTENELFKTFERLADFPEIGVAKPDRGEGVTGEELRARFEARKATFEQSQKVAG